MIDIDKELVGLKAQGLRPSENLRLETRKKVSDAAVRHGRHSHTMSHDLPGTLHKHTGLRPAYLTAAAAVLTILFFAAVLTAAPAQAAGYYTIDINTSISVAVDADDNVINVSAENDDASALLSGLDVKGRRFEEALNVIIHAAIEQQYLAEGGQVLVARFGEGEGLSQQRLDAIVGGQLPDGNVSALMLKGEKEQFESAKKTGGKAGVELLLSDAREIGIEDESLVEVIRQVKAANENASVVKEEPEGKGGKQGGEPYATSNGNGNDNKNPDKGKSDNVSKDNNGNNQGNGKGNDNSVIGNKNKDNDSKDANHKNKDKDKEHSQGGWEEGQEKDKTGQYKGDKWKQYNVQE